MRLRSIIGKRWALIACAAALCVLLTAGFLLFSSPASAGERAQAAAQGLNSYAFDLIFRPEERTLAVTMTLDYTNETGDPLEQLALRTWAGAYQSEDTSPAAIDALYDACYPNGFSPGGIDLEGVWWNDTPADHAYTDPAGTMLRVKIPALSPGEGGRLLLRCTLTIPECCHRFGHAGSSWQFGNALPILAVYENGDWRSDAYSPIGDPFVSACANYAVTLTAPAGYQCAATGSQRAETLADGRARFIMDAPACRDFAFALSDAWESASQKVNGIAVTAYAPTREGAKRAARDAAQALKTYGRLYGDYAWNAYTLCAVDFPFGGMEYPGLAFIGQSNFAEDWADTLELVIAHETAHQWFYALVGSDQALQPWQDEALSEYAMLRYVLDRYGRNAYDNLVITRVNAPMQERIRQAVTPGTPITDFASLDIYSTVVYGRGAAFLLAVEELTGKLDAFLRAYCDTYAFQLASREDFTALLNRITGEDLLPLMTDYLDTLMQ